MSEQENVQIKIRYPGQKNGIEFQVNQNDTMRQVIQLLKSLLCIPYDINIDQIKIDNKTKDSNLKQLNLDVRIHQIGQKVDIELDYQSKEQNQDKNQTQLQNLKSNQLQHSVQLSQGNQEYQKLMYQIDDEKQPTLKDPVFSNIVCDNCKACPLYKVRYSCRQCKDFDLCWSCFNDINTRKQHIHSKYVDFEKMTLNKIQEQQIKKAENIYFNLGLAGKIKRR